jgi:hypothetical protein
MFSLDVTNYGPIGTTDDAATFQAAINAARSAGGGIVYIPPGTYNIGTTLELKAQTRLVGAGNATVLVATSATDNLIEVSGFQAAIEHLTIKSFTNHTSRAYIRTWHEPPQHQYSIDKGDYLTINDCSLESGYDTIVIDYTTGLRILNCNIIGFVNRGIVIGLNSPTVWAQPGNTVISGCEIRSDQDAAKDGIYVKSHGGLFISQVDIYGGKAGLGTMEYGIRLDAAPTLPAIAWTFLDQVQCDTCKVDGLAANGTGQVSGLFASNSWFATNENVGFHIGYYARVAGVQLSGCQMVNNGASGVNLQFHSRQVAITGCIVSGNGRNLPSAGIAIAPGVEDVTLTGNIVGPFGQFSNLQTYGVFFNEPITRCTLVGNSLSHNISGAWNFVPPGVVDAANA